MMHSFARSVSPVSVVLLTVLWLLLNQSVSPGHILLGAVLGTGLSWAGSTLRPLHARIRRLDLAVAMVGIVFVDVVRSNIGVARVVLGLTGGRKVVWGFVDIPLTMRDPHAIAALAVILTATPGTVWVGVTPDGSQLRLHVLDLKDESYWHRLVKQRYERRLMEIFE